jgi:ABC-type bacteriocin/lantibiotic exporter with double-glycine peptidase domain
MLLPPTPPALVLEVPFFSQFQDISSPDWQKKSCGIASLAMIIEYYKPGTTTADRLLAQAIADKGYIENIGWTYKSLISVAQTYDLDGEAFDLGTLGNTAAFAKFKIFLEDGPVIVSVHYKFDPTSTIPHLVVIDGIVGNTLYYNDPAATEGEKKISVSDFLKGWKKKFIVIRPSP